MMNKYETRIAEKEAVDLVIWGINAIASLETKLDNAHSYDKWNMPMYLEHIEIFNNIIRSNVLYLEIFCS